MGKHLLEKEQLHQHWGFKGSTQDGLTRMPYSRLNRMELNRTEHQVLLDTEEFPAAKAGEEPDRSQTGPQADG